MNAKSGATERDLNIGPALAELSGRRGGRIPPFLCPAPGRVSLRDAVRAYWGAFGVVGVGERVSTGLTMPQLVEAVARVGIIKWAPGAGLAVGWMIDLNEREEEAWRLTLGRAAGGPYASALAPLPDHLHPGCTRIFVEWALRRVCDVAWRLGVQPSAQEVAASREDPKAAVAAAEAEAAGGSLGTALLNALIRKGLPLPGRPTFPPGFATVPPPVVSLAPEHVMPREGWKQKVAMSFRIAP